MILTEEQWESLRCESCGKTLNEIRGSKYAGDYCLGEIRLDPGQGASRSDPPIEPSYYFWCDECKNDSSEHIREPPKMVGFDLAARIRELEAENERLRASLIDLHAEYINTLEKNPECSAWDLDEQSDADQKRLRRNAAHAISIVEPPIYLQAEQRATKIKELEDVHKRSGVKYAKIINELRSSVYANIPGLKKQWDEILNAPANGKIGPDADAKPHCWQITEERKAAIDRGMRFLAWSNAKTNDPGTGIDLAVLRAMLTEAGQE